MRNQELVKQEEKLERIDRFIGLYLDRSQADWAGRPGERRIALIARSPASPVARALVRNSDELEHAGVAMRVIFSSFDPNPELSSWFEMANRSTKPPLVGAMRIASNPALLDAHEQLVMGNALSWFGDSMRRDPSVRDAIETFTTFCEDSARKTMRNFEAIWNRSTQVATLPMRPRGQQYDAYETLSGRIASDDTSGPVMPKRH